MSNSHEPNQWALAIDLLQRGGDFAHVPLLEAGKAGSIGLVYMTDRMAPLPLGRMRRAERPVMVLIGDDGDDPTGPTGWACAKQVTQWASGAIVHGADAMPSHYEMAIEGTLTCRRFLVIDTASRHIEGWLDLLSHVQDQVLLIVPNDGEHPVAQPSVTFH